MGSHRARRGMEAPPEIVLNTAADPARVQTWVTGPLRLGDEDVRVEPNRDGLRVEWGPVDDPRGCGQLAVDASGAGASSVELRLHCDGTEPDPAERMLDALADEVSQNFTAG